MVKSADERIMQNRRNFYRILHVQPDAPDEIIRTSYRTLMQRLKMHPDLGGDTSAAALINEAFATLRDPARRAAYDRQLGETLLKGRGGERRSSRTDRAAAPERASEESGRTRVACFFCEAPNSIQDASVPL